MTAGLSFRQILIHSQRVPQAPKKEVQLRNLARNLHGKQALPLNLLPSLRLYLYQILVRRRQRLNPKFL